jgi:hypothetical protein
MWRKVIAGTLTATLVGGGIAVEDIATADVVATLNDPITLNEAMKFRAPSHTVEISDNGLIELVVGGDKRYGLMPSEAAGKGKGLFLDIETAKDVTIKEAFGTGSEVILKNTPRSFSKVVSFTEDFLKGIPADAKYVEVSFDLSGWEVQDGTYTERIQLQQDVWLEKALAWDSSEGDPNQNYTDVKFVIENGTLTKRIPVEWLKTAQFPIYTDATFTFGTKELADASTSQHATIDKVDTDKAVICWLDNADTSAEGRCQIASVSGTDITFGSASNFTADIALVANNTFDSCAAGTDRWVVVFPDDADSDDGTARVASSTGTTINGYGTEFDFDNGVNTQNPTCSYLSTDKVLIVWGDITNTTSEAVACTINADYTLSCGTTATIVNYAANNVFDFSCATVSIDAFVCQFFDNSAASSPQSLIAGTVSGTTVTFGPTTTVTRADTADTFGNALVSPTNGKFAYIYSGSTGSSPQSIGLGSVSGTTITLGATSTLIATTSSLTAIVAIDPNKAFWLGQHGATDAATTFLAAIPIQLDWDTLTFSTSTAEVVDATTDPGSLHAAKIGDCKILFAWEDDNDTNDLFAEVATCASSFVPWQFMDW